VGRLAINVMRCDPNHTPALEIKPFQAEWHKHELDENEGFIRYTTSGKNTFVLYLDYVGDNRTYTIRFPGIREGGLCEEALLAAGYTEAAS